MKTDVDDTVKEIKNRILRIGEVDYKTLTPLQPENFKTTTSDRVAKLKKSLLNNGFAAPFHVWEADKTYILDGVHRCRALHELESEGVKIPKQPAIFIDAQNKKDAKKLLLVFNSHYADIQLGMLTDFVVDLDMDNIICEIDIPYLDLALLSEQPTLQDLRENLDEMSETKADNCCPKCGFTW